MSELRRSIMRVSLWFALAAPVALTGFLALRFWRGPHTMDNLWPWAALWVFGVLIPVVETYKLNRCLHDLARAYPDLPSRVRDRFAETRFSLLLCGLMTTMMAFMLGLRG
jgi:hypothetical protein